MENPTFQPEDETLGEALHSAYAEDNRRWIIVFCNVRIELTLACISDIYDDLIRILDFMDSGEQLNSNFLSAEILCRFNMDPVEDEIFIETEWLTAGSGDALEKLQQVPKMNIFCRKKFANEIRNFLQATKDDLISLGYGHHFDEENPWGIQIH